MSNMNELYDQLAKECGEKVENTDYKTVSSEAANEQVNKTSFKTRYAYEDEETVLPDAANTDRVIKDTVMKPVSKKEAIDNLLYQTALMKTQAEQDEINELVSKEEAQRLKKDIVEQLLYQQEQSYYGQYKHMMDGKTKRRVRKMIERDYDKGKYKPNQNKLNG